MEGSNIDHTTLNAINAYNKSTDVTLAVGLGWKGRVIKTADTLTGLEKFLRFFHILGRSDSAVTQVLKMKADETDNQVDKLKLALAIRKIAEGIAGKEVKQKSSISNVAQAILFPDKDNVDMTGSLIKFLEGHKDVDANNDEWNLWVDYAKMQEDYKFILPKEMEREEKYYNLLKKSGINFTSETCEALRNMEAREVLKNLHEYFKDENQLNLKLILDDVSLLGTILEEIPADDTEKENIRLLLSKLEPEHIQKFDSAFSFQKLFLATIRFENSELLEKILKGSQLKLNSVEKLDKEIILGDAITRLKDSEHLDVMMNVCFKYFGSDTGALVKALEGLSAEQLDTILEKSKTIKSKVNICDHSGDTPLHRCVKTGYLEKIKILLEHGGNKSLGIKNGDKRTPLEVAIQLGSPDIIEYLHGQQEYRTGGELMAILKNICAQPPQEVAWRAFDKVNAKLLTDGTICKLLNEIGDDDLTREVVCHVAQQQNISPFKAALYIKAYDFLEKVKILDEDKDTLYQVGYMKDTDAYRKLLVALKDQINKKNSEGKTALHVAAESDNLEAFLALVDAGADLGIMDNDRMRALDRAPVALQLAFLQHMSKKKQYKNSENNVVDLAVLHQLPKVIEKLEGSDELYHKKENGDRPIHMAARSGSLELFKAVIVATNGAYVTEKNKAKSTAMDLASPEMRFFALQHATIFKGAPLHNAIDRGYDDVIDLFDKDQINKIVDGKTPLDMANELEEGNKKNAIIEKLKDCGATSSREM